MSKVDKLILQALEHLLKAQILGYCDSDETRKLIEEIRAEESK